MTASTVPEIVQVVQNASISGSGADFPHSIGVH
ncbi:hypothetical protein Mal35_57650 [Gimesia maris]|nr:hypothetical protein Mal35_57650 [Gimesia maris]